jgi:hypothetical protein
MPKIRDLGIKVIPDTMRPPEVGGGGGGGCKAGTNQQCHATIVVLCDGGTCDFPTITFTCCPGTCDPTSTVDYGYEWSRDAVKQLKEHLRQRLAKLEEYEKNLGSKKPGKGGKKSSKKK